MSNPKEDDFREGLKQTRKKVDQEMQNWILQIGREATEQMSGKYPSEKGEWAVSPNDCEQKNHKE